jgi:hypothetical protein
MRAEFEAIFGPMPRGCTWTERGYCPTEFGAWDAQNFDHKFIGFVAAWRAARRAPAAPVPQIEPVHGDCLPPIGSRVFIRHGRDDDAHACIVTGYYVWGDLKGSKRLHRVFVRLVYEGTDTKQARMLCDCYATAEDAHAAAPQPPEADIGIPISKQDQLLAAPVQMPEPVAYIGKDGLVNSPENFKRTMNACTKKEKAWMVENYKSVYTEQQVRELLAAHGIKVAP